MYMYINCLYNCRIDTIYHTVRDPLPSSTVLLFPHRSGRSTGVGLPLPPLTPGPESCRVASGGGTHSYASSCVSLESFRESVPGGLRSGHSSRSHIYQIDPPPRSLVLVLPRPFSLAIRPLGSFPHVRPPNVTPVVSPLLPPRQDDPG